MHLYLFYSALITQVPTTMVSRGVQKIEKQQKRKKRKERMLTITHFILFSVDKLAETKGRDEWDTHEARKRAKEHSHQLYEEHYERGHGADEYNPNEYGAHEHMREHHEREERHRHHHQSEW